MDKQLIRRQDAAEKGDGPENLRNHPRGKILDYLAMPAIASFIIASKVSTSIAPEASSS